MTVAKSSAASIKIHINSVKPVLEGMRALGFSQEACLEGTDLHLSQLVGTDVVEDYLTLEQEYLLYKNILQISQDPYIGLKIGSHLSSRELWHAWLCHADGNNSW